MSASWLVACIVCTLTKAIVLDKQTIECKLHADF